MQSIILGVIQGICEFLPISSSGHLAIMQIYMGMSENMLTYDILLHFATLLATVLYFKHDILMILSDWFTGWTGERKSGWIYGWSIILTTLITGIIGILLKDTAERFSQSITLVGAGEIITGIMLLMMPIISRPRNFNLLTLSIVVGIAQGIAVLPGISRSGMSIFACVIMGMGISEAFRYSFLISIPAILGATMLEFLKAYKGTETIYLPEYGITGCISAFILGLLSLMIMRRIVKIKNWSYFGIYCIIIGIIAEVLV